MKVAVITPYYKTPVKWLHECHLSVKAQTYPCTHIIVADGQPYEVVDSWDAQHIKLPVNISDYGDTPRGVGSVAAIGLGFDAIAYLDADNWYDPEHIDTLLKLHKKTGAAVTTSARNLHRLDGTFLGKCFEVDGERFVDTSCLFLTRAAFNIIHVWWLMAPEYHAIDDRMIWANVKGRNLSRAHSEKATVAYRTAFTNHYRHFGENPPAGAKSGMKIYKVMNDLGKKQQLKQGVVTVRINKEK
jgi:glycosyltransferase involved in cell wall biosynthesis